MSALRNTKDICEPELGVAHTKDGKKFYEAVRSSSSNLIDYLRTGLASRFNEGDEQEIQTRLGAV